jgi:Zn-finger nucleic acid-binding protein
MEPVVGRNYLTCGYCHTFHFPTTVKDSADRITPLHEASDVACPMCSELLQAGALENIRIEYCSRCRGVLIANEQFGHVVRDRRRQFQGADQVPTPIDPVQFQRRLGCPRCGQSMDVHPYHGPGCVVIDTCSRCHLIWLDHGELSAIERAPGRRQPVVASYEPSAYDGSPMPSVGSVDKHKKRDQPSVDWFDILFG